MSFRSLLKGFAVVAAAAACAQVPAGRSASSFECRSEGPIVFDGTILESEMVGLLGLNVAASYRVALGELAMKTGDCTGDNVEVLLPAANPGYLAPGRRIRVSAQDFQTLQDSLAWWEDIAEP